MLSQSLEDSKDEILKISNIHIEIDQTEESKDHIKQLYESSDDSDIDANDDFIFEAVSETISGALRISTS